MKINYFISLFESLKTEHIVFQIMCHIVTDKFLLYWKGLIQQNLKNILIAYSGIYKNLILLLKFSQI